MNGSNYIGKYKDEDGEEYNLYYYIGEYSSNGRVSLLLYDRIHDEDYAVVTVNLPDVDLMTYLDVDCWSDADKYAFINGDLTEHFKKWLREKNVISDKVTTVLCNYGQYDLCKILVK